MFSYDGDVMGSWRRPQGTPCLSGPHLEDCCDLNCGLALQQSMSRGIPFSKHDQDLYSQSISVHARGKGDRLFFC